MVSWPVYAISSMIAAAGVFVSWRVALIAAHATLNIEKLRLRHQAVGQRLAQYNAAAERYRETLRSLERLREFSITASHLPIQAAMTAEVVWSAITVAAPAEMDAVRANAAVLTDAIGAFVASITHTYGDDAENSAERVRTYSGVMSALGALDRVVDWAAEQRLREVGKSRSLDYGPPEPDDDLRRRLEKLFQ